MTAFSKISKSAIPVVMGIINITPDSFYDGGTYPTVKSILKKITQYIDEGADIIDLGAYSSRPNALHISEKEEQKRLLPVLQEVVREFPKTFISIDTFRSSIAKKAINEGAHIINDISGGTMDSAMVSTIADLKVSYIMMHMQGTPQNMQQHPITGNVTEIVMDFFQKKIKELQKLNVNDVILDVGFGFGKTLDQNYELLKNLNVFTRFNKPLLVGISRKSMLYKLVQTTPEDSLNATSIAHTIALLNGASILRVHDVKEAIETIKITQHYKVIKP